MSIDTGPRHTSTATTTPVEVVVEMPISFGLVVADAEGAGEHDLADEIHLAVADGYRAAVDTLTTAARQTVPAIVRTGPVPQQREHGAITVTMTQQRGAPRLPFPYLYAQLLIDPTPVTGTGGDYVDGPALADHAPIAQSTAVRTAAETLQQAGYPVSRPRQSPHGFELAGYAEAALEQLGSDGARGFACPPTRTGAVQHYPLDQFDRATRADRAAGRL